MKTDPNNTEDMKTELLRRTYRLLAERDEVIAKRDSLQRALDSTGIPIGPKARAGADRILSAMVEGLDENRELVLEALALVEELYQEGEGDDAANDSVP